MRLLLVLALVLLPVPAVADPAAAKAWLCRTVPKWQRCKVTPPIAPGPPAMEAEPPIEFVPASPPMSDPAPAPAAKPAPRPAPQAKPRHRRVDQEHARPAPRTENGFCFFPISCSTVCEYARAGSSQRGTPCQNALGLACIRSTCPEVLRKKR